MKGYRRIRTVEAAILMCCFAVSPLRAHSVVPLGFEESVTLAAQQNAALRNARSSFAAAEHQRRAAYSGYLPQLSANVGYTDTTAGTASTLGTGSDYSAGLTLTQNLFSGFQDQARVEQGSANVEIALASLDAAKAELSRDLKVAYTSLRYAQDYVALTESILRRREENLRLVQLRFEGGRENKGAFLVTRASLAQSRFERLQAQQALLSAQTQLSAVIGQAPIEWQASGVVPVVDPPGVPDFVGLAQTTPELRQAFARERSASADIQLARAGFYPSINVSGSIGRDGNAWYPSDERRSLNASISIPLFSGGRDINGVRSAVASFDATQANRQTVERDVTVRLTQSYAAYVESVERLNVDREFLVATETRANITRARYQNGLVGFEEWDRVENDLIQRQKALLASERDRVGAEAAWELVQGKGVIP